MICISRIYFSLSSFSSEHVLYLLCVISSIRKLFRLKQLVFRWEDWFYRIWYRISFLWTSSFSLSRISSLSALYWSLLFLVLLSSSRTDQHSFQCFWKERRINLKSRIIKSTNIFLLLISSISIISLCTPWCKLYVLSLNEIWGRDLRVNTWLILLDIHKWSHSFSLIRLLCIVSICSFLISRIFL